MSGRGDGSFRNVRASGVHQFFDQGMIDARTAKFDRDYAYAIKSGEHLWQALALFAVSKKHLATKGPDEVMLDGENLYQVMLGCYICEAPYSPQLLTRRCPGEPSS